MLAATGARGCSHACESLTKPLQLVQHQLQWSRGSVIHTERGCNGCQGLQSCLRKLDHALAAAGSTPAAVEQRFYHTYRTCKDMHNEHSFLKRQHVLHLPRPAQAPALFQSKFRWPAVTLHPRQPSFNMEFFGLTAFVAARSTSYRIGALQEASCMAAARCVGCCRTAGVSCQYAGHCAIAFRCSTS
jgi:hypothetical protein